MPNQNISSSNDHIIGGDQRFSESIIWDIQRNYFLQNGMDAWQADVVPHYISSNPTMARAYSQVVFGYLRDCVAAAQSSSFSLDVTQPIYIVELGAGSGRLAHHFLHQFFHQQAQSTLAELNIKFIMTDFVPEIIAFWQQHERFKPWVEAGVLDFALFDVMDKRPLTLINSNQTLTPDQVQNPLILIANYFFDSIPQDSFVLEDGQLCQNLLSVYSNQPELNRADPTIWERLQLAWEAIPSAKPHYPTDSYNEILDSYELHLPDTTFSFPNVGLDCIRYWQRFGNGRLLLLTSDRGYTHLDSLLEQDNPTLNLHGSFSLMVNYHAIGQYVALQEGLVLQPEQYQNNLQVGAYLLGQQPQNGVETIHAFESAIGQIGPDDFFTLKQALEPILDSLTLPQILSYLRLSAWDADIFMDCFPTLLTEVQQAEPVWYEDVYEIITKVWEQYLPLGADQTLAQNITRLLNEMGYTAKEQRVIVG